MTTMVSHVTVEKHRIFLKIRQPFRAHKGFLSVLHLTLNNVDFI